MTLARCAHCHQPLDDSSTSDVSPGSGGVNLQLGLFGEAVPVEEVRASRLGGSRPGLAAGGRWQSVAQSERDAVAIVTAFFHHSQSAPDETFARVDTILAGRAAADLGTVAGAAALFAAHCLDALEYLSPGFGMSMLEHFALEAAAGS